MDAYDDLEGVLFDIFDVLADLPLASPDREAYRWTAKEFIAREIKFRGELARRMEYVRLALNAKYQYVLPEGCTFRWETAP